MGSLWFTLPLPVAWPRHSRAFRPPTAGSCRPRRSSGGVFVCGEPRLDEIGDRRRFGAVVAVAQRYHRRDLLPPSLVVDADDEGVEDCGMLRAIAFDLFGEDFFAARVDAIRSAPQKMIMPSPST